MEHINPQLPPRASHLPEAYAFSSIGEFMQYAHDHVIPPTLRITPKGNPGYNGFALIHIVGDISYFFYDDTPRIMQHGIMQELSLHPHHPSLTTLGDRTPLNSVTLLYHAETGKVWLRNFEIDTESFTESVPSLEKLVQPAAHQYSQ